MAERDAIQSNWWWNVKAKSKVIPFKGKKPEDIQKALDEFDEWASKILRNTEYQHYFPPKVMDDKVVGSVNFAVQELRDSDVQQFLRVLLRIRRVLVDINLRLPEKIERLRPDLEEFNKLYKLYTDEND